MDLYGFFLLLNSLRKILSPFSAKINKEEPREIEFHS